MATHKTSPPLLDRDIHSKTSIKDIVYALEKPLVLKGYLNLPENKEKWKCISWDIKEWSKLFGDETYPIQFGSKILYSNVQDFPQWEYLNLKGEMTYNNLFSYSTGNLSWKTTCRTDVNQLEYWAYFDYYDMKNLEEIDSVDEFMSWEIFNFPEIKSENCKIWIGTKGANTPCHIDTYGSNIVCQMYGRKRWTLFPQNQTPYLYPTRVPYEESSIYSEVGFPNPNLTKFPKLIQTTPYCITLEAGDVLLIPKHWWHFVENLEFSITINSWIPLPSDPMDRLKEAFVSYQVSSLCQGLTSTSLIRSIFHLEMLDNAALDSYDMNNILRSRISNYLIEKQNEEEYMPILITLPKNMEEVKMSSFEEYCACVPINIEGFDISKSHLFHIDLASQCDLLKLLINSFTDDRVIDVLKDVVIEKLKSNL